MKNHSYLFRIQLTCSNLTMFSLQCKKDMESMKDQMKPDASQPNFICADLGHLHNGATCLIIFQFS